MATLVAAKDLREMFDIEAVRYNSILNLVKTTGKTEAAATMHYEREKILFFKLMQTSKDLEKCDRFSIYSAWVELHASGATLNEGHAYIIPYGKVAQFQMGWKGRLEQLVQIPNIVNIPPPQVVYDNDEFDYELGEKPRIIKHKPAKENRGELAYVYVVVEKSSGLEVHIMTKAEVHNIRDRYSIPYKKYIAECSAQGKNIGEPLIKKMNGPNGPWDLTIEPPMWITSPDQAWKKTLVKRVYNSTPKSARMKALDERIKNNFDPEDDTIETNHETIDLGIEMGGEAKSPDSISVSATANTSRVKKERKTIADEPTEQKLPPMEAVSESQSGNDPQDIEDNPVLALKDLGDPSQSF